MTCVKCNHDGTKKFGYSGRKRVQRWRCLQCRATFVAPTLKPLGTQTTDLDTKARVLELMMEGTSVRAISRLRTSHQNDSRPDGHSRRKMPAVARR